MVSGSKPQFFGCGSVVNWSHCDRHKVRRGKLVPACEARGALVGCAGAVLTDGAGRGWASWAVRRALVGCAGAKPAARAGRDWSCVVTTGALIGCADAVLTDGAGRG